MANRVYTNSSLVVYTILSPNCNKGRVHKTHNPEGVIDKITIHHMAGNCTIESCGRMFADPDRRASSTYGIGTDGRIGQYCDEGNRPWTSSSAANDYRAVTIEVANDTRGPEWHISDKAFAALIELCVDICKRNNFRLTYDGTKNGSLTRHDMFAATTCPGPYLGSRFPEIVELVNARLDGMTNNNNNKIELSGTLYKVQVGAYSVKENAENMLEKIENDGFDAFITKVDKLYKVQVGAYSKKANAENMLAAVEAKGYDAFIQVEYSEKDSTKVESSTTPEAKPETKPTTKPETKPVVTTKPSKPAVTKIGEKDIVRVKEGARDYKGGKLASFVYTRDHIVSELNGNRAVITYKGDIVAAVHVNNLNLVKSASNTSQKPSTNTSTKKVTEGCKVKVKKGAKDYNGGKLYDFVYDRVHIVSELKGNRAVITYKGAVVAAVHINNLIVQ